MALAGGLGFIGAGFMSPAELRKEWQLATEQLAKGHADLKHSGLGIGLLNFKYSEVRSCASSWAFPAPCASLSVLAWEAIQLCIVRGRRQEQCLPQNA